MVIIYNIGIGKEDRKKASETIESERPKEKMSRERKANKVTKQAKPEQYLNVLKQKLSMTYLQID